MESTIVYFEDFSFVDVEFANCTAYRRCLIKSYLDDDDVLDHDHEYFDEKGTPYIIYSYSNQGPGLTRSGWDDDYTSPYDVELSIREKTIQKVKGNMQIVVNFNDGRLKIVL